MKHMSKQCGLTSKQTSKWLCTWQFLVVLSHSASSLRSSSSSSILTKYIQYDLRNEVVEIKGRRERKKSLEGNTTNETITCPTTDQLIGDRRKGKGGLVEEVGGWVAHGGGKVGVGVT